MLFLIIAALLYAFKRSSSYEGTAPVFNIACIELVVEIIVVPLVVLFASHTI